MIDINLIRNNPDLVRKSILNRQKDVTVLDKVLDQDKLYRQILSEAESLRSQQNTLTKSFKGKPTADQIYSSKKIKDQLKLVEDKLKITENDLNNYLEEIPNISSDDTPIGKDDNDNVIIKTIGEKPIFDFKPKDHVELGELLDIIDIKKASELSGSRFGYFKGKAAVLEMAIMFYSFKLMTEKGFVGMIPPVMIKSKTEWGCGYASNKNLMNAYYSIPEDDLIFISSSEHSVVPYHQNEILESSAFPIKYINFSPCFRREAGTYGKDTRGLFRVHFFNKVEMNVFTLPDIKLSDDMCLEMLSHEESLMQSLKLPYQVVQCCTGDLPQPNRRMYDVNTWFPGQNNYRETQSCSNCTDYQARRLQTKVKLNGKNELVHILNATLITDRAVLAIIENFQTKEGNINIPEVLWPYTGFKQISPT